MAEQEPIRRETFQEQEIDTAGKSYVHCIFNKCKLLNVQPDTLRSCELNECEFEPELGDAFWQSNNNCVVFDGTIRTLVLRRPGFGMSPPPTPHAALDEEQPE